MNRRRVRHHKKRSTSANTRGEARVPSTEGSGVMEILIAASAFILASAIACIIFATLPRT